MSGPPSPHTVVKKDDLISTVITGNLFAKNEHFLVTNHFFLHGDIEGIPNGHLRKRNERNHGRYE